jgi:acylphosphatase
MSHSNPNARIETYLVHARGSLHSYRNSTVRHAHALGIRGWIRVLDDGGIEALVQGEPDQIDRMLEWMRHGPPGAKVREFVSREDYIDKRYDRFEQQ